MILLEAVINFKNARYILLIPQFTKKDTTSRLHFVTPAKQTQLNTAWAEGLHDVRVNWVQRVRVDNQTSCIERRL